MALQKRLESDFGLTFRKRTPIHFLLALERWIEYRKYLGKPLTNERVQSLVRGWEGNPFEFRRAVAYSLDSGKSDLCRHPEDEVRQLKAELEQLRGAA